MHPRPRIDVVGACVLLLATSGCRRDKRQNRCSDDAIVLTTDGSVTTSELVWDRAGGVYSGPVVEFVLPEGTVGFLATVDLPGVDTGFSEVFFSGRTWVDASTDGEGAWDSAPFFHWAALGGSLVAPINAESTPMAGCLRLRPAALEEGTAQLLVDVRVEQPVDPRVDVDVVVVGETQLFQEDLDEALAVMDSLWRSGGGPGLGSTEVLAHPGDTFLPYESSTALRGSVVEGARDTAIRVYFIQDYLEADGTLGEAGGIPGPLRSGVDEAGVIVSLDAHLFVDGTLDTELLGEVMAHEIGHQLGLFHTTESDGARTEALVDTPECPADADANADGMFSAEECSDADGSNFMFWTSGDLRQDTVSPEQGFVLGSSVLVQEAP